MISVAVSATGLIGVMASTLRAESEEDGERVVHAGIGVDDDAQRGARLRQIFRARIGGGEIFCDEIFAGRERRHSCGDERADRAREKFAAAGRRGILLASHGSLLKREGLYTNARGR
jgi:hypothetical protein